MHVTEGDWETVFHKLKQEYIRCIHEHEPMAKELAAWCHGDSASNAEGDAVNGPYKLVVAPSHLAVGEGCQMLSWIWYPITGGDLEDEESGTIHWSLWAEWAKSRACSHHWREELILLNEEMC